MNFKIQQANNKLNNNLRYLKLDSIEIQEFNPNKILYRSHYERPYTHILFVESLITNEIKQFISEFFQSIKFFVYHDKQPNLDLIKHYKTAAKHIVNKSHSIRDTITLPNLINDQIFKLKDNIKNEDIICFLEYRNTLPNKINNLLYPKTKHHIKLFNSPHIKHMQNLGIISELEKASILQSSKYYLPIDHNDEYIPEAISCGCSILDNSNLQPMDMDIDLSSYQTYASFIKGLVND